jgi:hypothetical protein
MGLGPLNPGCNCCNIATTGCDQCIDTSAPQRVTITLPSLEPDATGFTCCDFSGTYELEFEGNVAGCTWYLGQPDEFTQLWPCNEPDRLQYMRFTRLGTTATLEAVHVSSVPVDTVVARWQASSLPFPQDCFESPMTLPFDFSAYCNGTGDATVVPGP